MFRNKYNYEKSMGEIKSDKPSLTVPDQSFTVREIFERNKAGALEDIEKQAVYDDIENGFVISPIDELKDLTDIDRLKVRIDESIKKKNLLRNEIKKRKKDKQELEIQRLKDIIKAEMELPPTV